VLDLPHFEIARGETLGIVGPSGAGKSTLLRLLQFVERPSSGTVVFDDKAVTFPVSVTMRRRVTTVFQRPVLLDRSVRDNVAFGLRLRGNRRAASRVDTWLDRLGLAALAGEPAHTLSGGEMQRVALGRALAIAPDVLLLDEPAANLDPANVALVEQLVRDEQARGITIVLVTHNAHEASRLADRTTLLLAGRVVETAATTTFFERPQDARTRAFLSGDMVY
jgi:tungstate transport system ATP-binding protein